jgi:hypothetical protein
MNEPKAQFTIADLLEVDWTGQLLNHRAIFDSPVNLAEVQLVDGHGEGVVFQATDVDADKEGLARSATLWFWTDLAAGDAKTFRIVPGERAGEKVTATRTDDSDLVLENGILRIRLPGNRDFSAPVPAAEVPGPIAGAGRSNQPWIGGSRWETDLCCRRVETRILEAGPVWTEAEVAYTWQNDASYRMRVKLMADRDFALIDERIGMRYPATVILSFYDGLEPDRFYTHGSLGRYSHHKAGYWGRTELKYCQTWS